MGKYTPFINYLLSIKHKRRSIQLTFSEIESIIGETLPISARKHNAWWGNDVSGSHSWARDWCNAGWRSRGINRKSEIVTFDYVGKLLESDSEQALEGYLIDRNIVTCSRNQKLVQERKLKDKNTCQACGFSLSVGGKFVIDVHHLEPLSISNSTITSIEYLTCLCPTCHRIAHLRKEPLGIQEIQMLLQET
ncbi:HNH endonuclease [Photobacterium sanguinicancri]|uniref:HNH endonuclease n=1 Tax=Photobacterium sanguinicancri TaxID=875932 RepID=UPI003D0E5E50